MDKTPTQSQVRLYFHLATGKGFCLKSAIGGSAEDILLSYPFDEPIRSGECQQSWMVYSVGDATVTGAHYRNDMGESAAWRVG